MARKLLTRRSGLGTAAAVHRLAAAVFGTTGRLARFAAGVALVFSGFFVSMTLIGAVLGVPMVILGILLAAGSVFSSSSLRQ